MDGSHECCNQIDTRRTHELGPKTHKASAGNGCAIGTYCVPMPLYRRVLIPKKRHALTSKRDAQPGGSAYVCAFRASDGLTRH